MCGRRAGARRPHRPGRAPPPAWPPWVARPRPPPAHGTIEPANTPPPPPRRSPPPPPPGGGGAGPPPPGARHPGAVGPRGAPTGPAPSPHPGGGGGLCRAAPTAGPPPPPDLALLVLPAPARRPHMDE